MADIELVIKIPEEDYEIMKHNIAVDNPLCPLSEKEMVAIIANGIPLPKGHGRLIDADAIKIDYYGEWNGLCVTEDTYKKSTIKNAATIIEADQESDVE